MAESVFDYLAAHQLLTLATASKGGIPHATPCMYANEGTTVFFSTADDSTTANNLAENPVAALAVTDDPGDNWNNARGAQITGKVSRLEGDDVGTAAGLFASRYPFLGDANDAPYYRLDPHDVRFVDNTESTTDDEAQALGVSWKRTVVHRVFRSLRPDELADITSRMDTETFPAGSTLIRAGEEGDRFYVIVEGRARATNAEGQTLTELGPGSFAGEIAILRGGPRTATVTAVTEVTAVSLSKDDFEHILDSSPELRKEFEEISTERLARG